jgi:hypothetical protein
LVLLTVATLGSDHPRLARRYTDAGFGLHGDRTAGRVMPGVKWGLRDIDEPLLRTR